MTEPQPNYFVFIPTHVLDNPKIDDSTAILYGRLASLANNKGYAYPSDKYLAEICHCKERVISDRFQAVHSRSSMNHTVVVEDRDALYICAPHRTQQ